MNGRYLEDFAVGQIFSSGRLRVTQEQIKAFAAEFDPQPFHLDEAAAQKTFFKGLAASGWHMAALTMRLLVEGELRPAGGVIGAGFDEFRWPNLCGQEMSCALRAKYWRCDRRDPGHTRD